MALPNTAQGPRTCGALSFCALLAAAGLAPPALAAATPAPTDPSGFRFEPLPAGGSVDFEIDRQSPTFEFQSGRSRFRAFVLPPIDRGYLLEVRSFLSQPNDPRRVQLFYPVVAILTDDFLVSRTTDLESLSFDLPVLERTTTPAYRVSLPLIPGNSRERYVVVFTPAKLATLRALPPIAGPESALEAAKVAYLGAVDHGHLRITLQAGEAGKAVPPPEGPAP